MVELLDWALVLAVVVGRTEVVGLGLLTDGVASIVPSSDTELVVDAEPRAVLGKSAVEG